MAPSFLSKFVKSTTSSHSRERSSDSFDSPRTSTGLAPSTRTRTTSTSANNSQASIVPPASPSPATPTPNSSKFSTVPSISIHNAKATDSDSSVNSTTNPDVTIVPPSPLVNNRSLINSDSDHESVHDRATAIAYSGTSQNTTAEGRTTSSEQPSSAPEEDFPTPTPGRPPSRSEVLQRELTSSSSQTSLHELATSKPLNGSTTSSSMGRNNTPEPTQEVRRQSSNKSLNNNAPPQISISHARAATSPPATGNGGPSTGEKENGAAMTPIVESPTGVGYPEYPKPLPPSPPGNNGNTYGSSMYSRSNTLQAKDNSDAKSFISTNGGEKKRPWRRSSTNKPTGLASAIAASGLAMANPTMTAAQQVANKEQITNAPLANGSTSRKSSNPGSPPYLTRSPPGSSNHVKGRSADMSPRSTRTGSESNKSPKRRTPSISVHSDNNSEYYGEDRPEYYSGLDDGSSGDDSSGEEDDLLDLDLGEDDIPVTGFAVASNKRNADFHELFPTIPEGDYLIEDYGCALQREILIQGRIYISENHICFHANIFGWITDLSIPIYEITSLEKKMTAFVIPNAIQITTRQNKYTFASFLSRDTTYDVIYNIWRLARPEDNLSSAGNVSARTSVDQVATRPEATVAASGGSGGSGGAAGEASQKKATQCTCGKEGKHYSEKAMEAIFPGTPEKIHNLMFASGFIKEFMAVNQKLLDIQMSDWQPTAPGSRLLTRNMSYIKPLNGSLGPKQTKCELKDEMVFCDFNEYVSTETTTRTPDVPSGGVFSVKTRTCITWSGPISSKVLVTTQVEWTGRSFIKGIIERSAIDGQKVYHGDLEKAMRAYIQEHQSEFVPEGVDPSALVAVEEPQAPAVAPTKEKGRPISLLTEDEKKQREHERNQAALQWAWDTFDGAAQVAQRSTKGALELVRDAWEQSTSTTILYFVIVLLVFSNIWTLTRIGAKEEARRRKDYRKAEEREKWVQSVVTALWDELAAGKKEATAIANTGLPQITSGTGEIPWQKLEPGDIKEKEEYSNIRSSLWKEVENLQATLDAVEQRVKAVRQTLSTFSTLNDLE